jgi:hypothetical protein
MKYFLSILPVFFIYSTLFSHQKGYYRTPAIDPDIVVDNLPNETFKGKDAQLEYAIKYLKKKIKNEPVPVPPPPAYPDKSFKYKAY